MNPMDDLPQPTWRYTFCQDLLKYGFAPRQIGDQALDLLALPLELSQLALLRRQEPAIQLLWTPQMKLAH
jgi:hypothetical protein